MVDGAICLALTSPLDQGELTAAPMLILPARLYVVAGARARYQLPGRDYVRHSNWVIGARASSHTENAFA
jgi:hypothetical protein